jgi:DNA-binding transcriptional regulator YiaG
MAKRTQKVISEKTTTRQSRARPQWQISPEASAILWDAETVKALREHLQMTQIQMAKELGTRQQTISEWEVGMYKPRGGMARLLSLVAERAQFEYKVKDKK